MPPIARTLRNLFIGLHLLAVTLIALPSPAGQMSEKRFAAPATQQLFARVATLLGGIGVDTSAGAISDFSWVAGRGIVAVRTAVLAPLQPYYTLAGTRQSWRMFTDISAHQGRIEIIAERDGEQEVLFIDNTAHRWQAQLLEQERVRSIRSAFSRRKNKRHYLRLCRWLAAQAAEDFPSADALIVQMRALTLAGPEVVRAAGVPAGEVFWRCRQALP